MPSTANFGWPTPEDTAQVANGPAIIRALGDAADATVFAQGTAIAAQGTAIADLDAKNIPDFTDDVPSDGQALVFDGAVGKYAPQAVAPPTTDGFLFAGTRYFTDAVDTFEKANPLGTGDIGLRAIRVTVVGAGGGGGGAEATENNESSQGSGGGAGGCSIKFYLASDLSSSETATRGAGGGGGVGLSSGSVGGASSFGTQTANGGGRGERIGAQAVANEIRAAEGGTGGTSSGGDLNLKGGAGGYMIFTGRSAIPGAGGDSVFQGGGRSAPSSSAADSLNGEAGGSPGAGGSGAFTNINASAERTGGAGANGIVIIDCFV